MQRSALNLAVVGAGPVGLGLALHAARLLPQAQITLFDARALDTDVATDPRTLALSLGSVQMLRRLQAWPAELAQPIEEVHVSQAPPAGGLLLGNAEVTLSAADEGVSMLGAVLSYGVLVDRLQQAWLAQAAAAPARLHTRFGSPVSALKPLAAGIEVDAGIAEAFDLVVTAEGGVFAEQARKSLTHDYGQTAWVGTVTLQGAPPATAFERFTRDGPLALLPLPPQVHPRVDADDGSPASAGTRDLRPPAGGARADPLSGAAAGGTTRAALVWCVDRDNDPVAPLSDAQRLAVLATLLPPQAGQALSLSPLKSFALGLNAQRSLVQGRTVRIGNAAQTLHPVAGQGLNLGLRDVCALVDALRWCEHLDQALDRVEWARAPDRWSTIALTDFLARSFTWRLPGVAASRGLGLAALQRAAPLKSWLARRMMFGGR